MIVGAMKCGTTSLFSYLKQHPRIAGCETKEPDFFSIHWSRGLDWYQGLWRPVQAGEIALEASTSYTKLPDHPEVVERMLSTPWTFKLIYVVRDPLERIESHYNHGRRLPWNESRRALTDEVRPRLINTSR